MGDEECEHCTSIDSLEGPAYGEVGGLPSPPPLILDGWERVGGTGKRSRSENFTGVHSAVGLNEAAVTGTGAALPSEDEKLCGCCIVFPAALKRDAATEVGTKLTLTFILPMSMLESATVLARMLSGVREKKLLPGSKPAFGVDNEGGELRMG